MPMRMQMIARMQSATVRTRGEAITLRHLLAENAGHWSVLGHAALTIAL